MGYVTLKFLGSEYQVSEAANEFLKYDELLTPTMLKIVEKATSNFDRDRRIKPSSVWNYRDDDLNAYFKIITDGAEILLKKLFDLGIYDVTLNDLLKNTSNFEDMDKIVISIGRKLVAESERFLEMKEAGLEQAYRYASSKVTGSGIGIITSSFSALMIHSFVEKNIMLSQAKKADQEYRESAHAINIQVNYGYEKMCQDIIYGEYYPLMFNQLVSYINKIMSAFFNQLISHGKFDFESIELYDMRKAEEMLNNIDKVTDKKEFLKQSFTVCPFCIDVYSKCIEFGLLDLETYQTAKYFGLDGELHDEIKQYISENKRDFDKISFFISLLSSIDKCSEGDILINIYNNDVQVIKNNYNEYINAISDKKKLDKLIRKNIIKNMTDILSRTEFDIKNVLVQNIKEILPENKYTKFIQFGILTPQDIRIAESNSVSLEEINNEIILALLSSIVEYKEEAIRRWNKYEKESNKYNLELNQREKEIDELKKKKKNLRIFDFSKKKEVSLLIDEKQKELTKYTRENDPQRWYNDFEKMYK